MSNFNYNTEAKKYSRRIDVKNSTGEEIISYVRFKTEQYKKEEWFDEELWETFVYDFEHFTLQHWELTDKGTLQSLRKTLRSAGVNVKKDETSVWHALDQMVNLYEFVPWSEKEIKKSLKDKSFTFTSGKILCLLEN